MATLLYVRTHTGGAGPAFSLRDLGIIISTGSSWTLLSASDVESALGSDGQFTARELRDSQDLFEAIRNSDLEWSTDGITNEAPIDYVADYMLFEDFSDDLSDALPAITASGQFLMSVDGEFRAVTPMISLENGWLLNSNGEFLIL